jgi:hypothetical protein
MKTRNVKISLETAQRWYNGTDNELKELAAQTYPEVAKKELPKSWEELGSIEGYYVSNLSNICDIKINKTKNIDKNTFATKEQAEASIAMAQLSQLMKVYNNGWQPDWTDIEYIYCIGFTNEKLYIDKWYDYKQFLSFKDRKTAELFLENFRELIETAKPLL